MLLNSVGTQVIGLVSFRMVSGVVVNFPGSIPLLLHFISKKSSGAIIIIIIKVEYFVKQLKIYK